MRAGISFTVSPTDRQRLTALIRDRNAPQKHVWRAEIILLSVNGTKHRRDHTANRQIEDLRVALAGALRH